MKHFEERIKFKIGLYLEQQEHVSIPFKWNSDCSIFFCFHITRQTWANLKGARMYRQWKGKMKNFVSGIWCLCLSNHRPDQQLMNVEQRGPFSSHSLTDKRDNCLFTDIYHPSCTTSSRLMCRWDFEFISLLRFIASFQSSKRFVP